MLTRRLWPHRIRTGTLGESQLAALRAAVLESPYLAESDLNEGFTGTQGFSLLFKRDQFDRVAQLLPAFVPFLEATLKPQANAFFLNPLVIHGGGAVRAHADKTLSSYLAQVPYPFCVSVLYVALPTPRTGGRLVFHRWFGRHGLQPEENLLLEFPGWLKHEVTELRSESGQPRVSIVLEQYQLSQAGLEELIPWHLDSNRPFDFFLEQALSDSLLLD